MEVQNIVPINWCNQRVLLTTQLAEAYNCSVEQIKKNFSNNKKYYKEGLHYFKIAGELLEELRVKNLHLQISPMTRTLYLWTEQGAVRHCKSINTKEAWEMFDELEENYFHAVIKTTPVLTDPVEKIRRPLSPTACVYALLMSNGTVKIGHSGNLRQRVAKIKRQTGLTVNKLHFTFDIAREIARTIEWACQENFSSQRMKGEFFNVEFAEICNGIDSSLQAQIERNDNLLKIADRMESSSERHLILIRAANFFVGQCSA